MKSLTTFIIDPFIANPRLKPWVKNHNISHLEFLYFNINLQNKCDRIIFDKLTITILGMCAELSDSQLLEQIMNSDIETFRQLFERYQPILFRQILYQIGDTDAAHDIVQQTFISVWEHRFKLKPQLSFLAYIFRISRNLVYDSLKHQKVRERVILHPTSKSELDEPDEALQAKLLNEKVVTIINAKLPQKCREIFLLSRFEGKSNREIADSLHLSVRTVEHQINKGINILRRYIKRH